MFHKGRDKWKGSFLTRTCSATVLQNITDELNQQPDAVVAYFYFDFNSTEKQHTRGALHALLFQLALNLPDVFQQLEQLYKKCKDGQNQPSEDDVRSLLYNAMGIS